MNDLENIEELEAEIEEDRERYSLSTAMEEDAIRAVSQPGFAAACQRVRLVAERQALAERIRRSRIMLVWARNSEN